MRNSMPKSACPSPVFLEAVCLIDGKPQHRDDHIHRMRDSLSWIGSTLSPEQLLRSAEAAVPNQAPGRWKLRFEYSASGLICIDPRPYRIQQISRLVLRDLPTDTPLDQLYPFKFRDRSMIDTGMKQLEATEHAVFLYNGMVTDAAHASLAFRHNDRWYTPDTPLLPGTTRCRLLQSGVLQLARITRDTLRHYHEVCLINAMMPLRTLRLPISAIQ